MGSRDEQLKIYHESTLDLNGTATLTFPDVPGLEVHGFRGPKGKWFLGPKGKFGFTRTNMALGKPIKLLRNWFFIATKSAETVLKKCMGQCMWHAALKPIDASVQRVHMPYWNNQAGGLPW